MPLNQVSTDRSSFHDNSQYFVGQCKSKEILKKKYIFLHTITFYKQWGKKEDYLSFFFNEKITLFFLILFYGGVFIMNNYSTCYTVHKIENKKMISL